MKEKKEMCGLVFNGIKIISEIGTINRQRNFLCECHCGKQLTITYPSIKIQKSCGCLRKNQGHSRTGAYQSWRSMMRRCYDKKICCYFRYGAVGIYVCERWHDYQNFFADMGERPEGTTLDRIDSFGNYTPENCRWASLDVQSNNKRNVKKYEYDGKSLSLAQWAVVRGIKYRTLRGRVHASKWSIGKALGYEQ